MVEALAAEQYDTLPEVPQPADNPVLTGHGEEAAKLAVAYQSGRLHHALLVHGPRGIGKATLAFSLARHLLLHPEPGAAPPVLTQPEAGSSLFRQIATGVHPGLLHLTRPLDKDGKKFRTSITIDEVRRVSKFLSMTSHDGGYRVVIVDPADDMNANAANALLKNLEEPPPRSVFMLISHAPGGLLPTIRSRCQSIRLQPLSDSDVFDVLSTLGEPVPEDGEKRREIANLAKGSPRNALLMTRYGGFELTKTLDEIIGGRKMDYEQSYRLAEAVSARDAEVQFSVINEAILERIAESARKAARERNMAQSARLSELWHSARQSINETQTFNLDKKQHIVSLVARLRDCRA